MEGPTLRCRGGGGGRLQYKGLALCKGNTKEGIVVCVCGIQPVVLRKHSGRERKSMGCSTKSVLSKALSPAPQIFGFVNYRT